MGNKEAKCATEIKLLNAVASNNFLQHLLLLTRPLWKKKQNAWGEILHSSYFTEKSIKHQKTDELFIKNKIEFSVLAISSET